MHGRRLGDMTILRALELHTTFDPAAFFPDTTPEDWAPHRHWLEPHAMDPASGHLVLPMQSYVVRTRHHTILVDTCVGNDKHRPTRPRWHMKSDDTYLAALAAHGLAPEDIDFVMCTHMHGDHVGWNTRLVDGRWVPTFPNARYVFSRREYEAWEKGHPKFARDAFEDSVLPVVEAGRAVLVENDHALDDEVWLEPTPGHTPDHVAIRLASNGASGVMCGDLMHCPVQCLYPEWTAWPDWDAALAKRTRRAFLERYADTDTVVCTAHFPLPSSGRVVSDGDGFRFVYDAEW
ncbi:MAG: MBL fold metallo-hydrolase [Ectothiorhodospiraceae bacterium]|nr:MBL fold metallo-hydrolase [Chromatiales bacterium]MCP5156553.1 MBL fold metallo-hydrolase [Ectothiorhodospiraceae bacterium]